MQSGTHLHVWTDTALCLTKIDVLDAFDSIKVCTAYKDSSTGELLESFPAGLRALESVECVYETVPGWGGKLGGKTEGVKVWEELPENARRFVDFIEQRTNVKVKSIGTGPERDHLVTR
jgi:adenylosuccinate synthase